MTIVIPFEGAWPSNNQYTESIWPFGLYTTYCNGTESSIWDCSYSFTSTGGYSCTQSRQASLKCQCKL